MVGIGGKYNCNRAVCNFTKMKQKCHQEFKTWLPDYQSFVIEIHSSASCVQTHACILCIGGQFQIFFLSKSISR